MAEYIIFSNLQENDLSYSFDVEYHSDLGLQPPLSNWSFRLETYFDTTIFVNPLSTNATIINDSYTCEYLGINKYHIILYGKLMHYGTFLLTINYSLMIDEITTNYEIISDKLICYLPPKFLFGELSSKNYIINSGSNDKVIPYNENDIPINLLSANSAYPYFEKTYEITSAKDQSSGARPNYYENNYLYTNGLHLDNDIYLSGETIKSTLINNNTYQVDCSGIIPFTLSNRYKFSEDISAYQLGIYDAGRNINPINANMSIPFISSADDYLLYNFHFNIDNSANLNISLAGDLYINTKLIEYNY